MGGGLQYLVILVFFTRFMDSSTLMHETAVNLIGRLVLMESHLVSQYYEMLLDRIKVS